MIIKNEVINSGLIIEPPKFENYHSKYFGAVKEDFIGTISPLDEPPVIFKDGIGWKKVWLEYNKPELQFNPKFDTFSCVIFTIAKAICLYIYKVYGITITISEMYNAFFAEVVANSGTTIEKGMESFRKHGWIEDFKYPFTKDTTAKQYFVKPPKTIQVEAEGVLTTWNFHWEVIPNNLQSIFKHYEQTTVVLTGHAWASENGIYFDYGYTANHAFLGLEKSEKSNNNICDTYPKNFLYKENKDVIANELIKELDKSFKYGSAHRCWVTPVDKNKISILTKIKNMFTKIVRDQRGGLWFHKAVEKDGKKFTGKQKLESWLDFAGAIVDEIGAKEVKDNELNSWLNYRFFGK